MRFKDISYLELWQPFCSAEWIHLCNFGRRHHEEQLCEIILNLDQWFKKRCRLKIFLICSSFSPFVQLSGTICAILVWGIMRNNSVKLFWIWLSGSGGDVGPPVQWSGTIQKFNFLNMVMWHIKLKGMNSSPGYTENFYPTIKLVTLGWGQRVNYHEISLRVWGFAMAPSNVF